MPTGAALAADADAQSGRALEELIVTARRKEENVQEVPVAITALDENALRERSAESPVDLQYMSPSLSITNGTNASVTLRGQGQGFGGQAPAVVSYLDEVALNGTNAITNIGFFDLQNIQVLKGPQGTLFGRNTTGGAILYTSKRPTEILEGYAEVKAGNYNLREVEGALNVPLVDDTLLLRIAGQNRQRDGYTDNIVTGKDMDNVDQQGLRSGLTLKVSDTVENYLGINYAKSSSNGISQVLEDVRASASSPVHLFYGRDYDNYLAQQKNLGVRKVAINTREKRTFEDTLVTNITTWEIDDHLILKNIAHYAENHSPVAIADFDASVHQGVEIEARRGVVRSKVEELQLQGDALDQRLDFVVGAYYENIETNIAQYTRTFLDASYPNVPALFGPLAGRPVGSTTYTPTQNTAESKALFGQATYDLGEFVEGLSFTAGIRRTDDKRDTVQHPYMSRVSTGSDNFACTLPAGQPCRLADSNEWKQTTWTVGFDYHITPDAMLYIASRKGYKAGGFNTFAPSPDQLSFDPETVKDVELGAKAEWDIGDMRARTNVAWYQSKYEDIQRTDNYLDANLATRSFVTNTAKATITGVEVEASLLPTDDLQMDLLYSYLDAGYDDYVNRSGVDLSYLPFQGAPMHRVTTKVSYRVPVPANLGAVTVSADYSWQDRVTTASATNPATAKLLLEEADIRPYHLVNARIQWSNVMSSAFDVGVFGTNLTDEEYWVSALGAGDQLGITAANYGAPRMYGVDAAYRF